MTARPNALIYAVGGGHGHAVRGTVICDRISEKWRVAELVIRAGALNGVNELHVPYAVSEVTSGKNLRVAADVLIVDTFPLGWRDALSLSWLKSFGHRVLIARYNRELDWDLATELYHEIWLPYSEVDNEWNEFPGKCQCIGFLVRENPPLLSYQPKTFALVDPEGRCPQSLVHLILERAEKRGFEVSFYRKFPSSLHSQRVLVVGAGYNTFYELLDSECDVRFLPIKKRFDDQHRRVRMWDRGVESLKHFERWLDMPSVHPETFEELRRCA